ncbi:MAG: hypothetical protein DME79_08555 [Verrucomicrobia bacterium]|nr:MAG: hypothetical protein DME79_08555 [Verrucomicrobiota bacterium]
MSRKQTAWGAQASRVLANASSRSRTFPSPLLLRCGRGLKEKSVSARRRTSTRDAYAPQKPNALTLP